MTSVCPRCGSPRSVRHAPGTVDVLGLVDGRVVEVTCDAPRHLCKACDRTFTVRDPVAVSLERAARDHVAELVFASGQAPVARRIGQHRSRVARLMRDWAALREPDVEGVSPDFLAVEVVTVAGADRVLLVDVDTESMVGVLPDRASLGAWLVQDGRLPALRVSVPLDVSVANAVRRYLPRASVMLPPSTGVRAVKSTLVSGLRALAAGRAMRGRNAMPGAGLFLRVLEGRAVASDGWPREVVALLGAGRVAREIVFSGDRARAERLWSEFDVAAHDVPGAGHLVRFMRTWRDAILSGIEHRFVDKVTETLAGVRRAMTSRRPILAFADLRAFVLLRDAERRPAPSFEPGPTVLTVPAGRPLRGLTGLLAS